MMEAVPLLKAEHLTYSYEGSDGSPALDDLDLEIIQGERTAILGSNGSGKSTFFLCCNGILRPDSGRIFFRGKPYCYDRKSLLDLRHRVGIVFQDPDDQLFCADVEQEISFGPMNLGLSEEETRRAVDSVISALQLGTVRRRPVHALSGGQKKQVAIADILVMSPELMILDEPAAALDPRHRAIVRNMTDRLSEKGITVLLSTHDIDYAYQWADRVILFHRGTAVKQGTPLEVFRDRAILEETGLTPPAVLTVYDTMTEAGLLDKRADIPKSMEALADCIRSAGRNRR